MKKTPKIGLVEKRNKKSITYYARYAINGKPIYRNLGTNKKLAKNVIENLQAQALLSKNNIPSNNAAVISLRNLVAEYLRPKQSYIQKSSLNRYKNYSEKLIAWFEENFPDPCYVRGYTACILIILVKAPDASLGLLRYSCPP